MTEIMSKVSQLTAYFRTFYRLTDLSRLNNEVGELVFVGSYQINYNVTNENELREIFHIVNQWKLLIP